MTKILEELLLTAVLATICGLLAAVLRANKQRILTYTTELIQRAEVAVQGSGMGEAKKKLVVAQLEAAGIRITAWVSAQIDLIVAALNSRGAWLAAQTKQASSGLADAVSKSDTEAVK